MAKDVEHALLKIIELAGGKTLEESKAYIDAMKKEKRYRKDVY
jgi:sulfite reductase (NADPH) flavoprotein alpha-component